MCLAQRAIEGNAKGSRPAMGQIHGEGNHRRPAGVWHAEGPEVDQRAQGHVGDLPGVASHGYVFCGTC
jgi:hypothetical protein